MKRPVPAAFVTEQQSKKYLQPELNPSTCKDDSTTTSKVREVQFDPDIAVSSTARATTSSTAGSTTKLYGALIKLYLICYVRITHYYFSIVYENSN